MYYYNNNVRAQNFKPNLEEFFPEIYKELFPIIMQAAEDFLRSGAALTKEIIDSIVDNIIKQCGLWDEDADTNVSMLSAQLNQPRRFRRRHHNRNSLRDLIRIILLRRFLES